MHAVSWALALAIFWLLLSGMFEPLLLLFGVVSVGLVVLAVKKMDSVDKQPKPLPVNFKLLAYFSWLITQIIKSSSGVARLVWRSPESIAPALGVIPTKTDSATGSVLYANSITLTPGTLSVDLSEDAVTVHALQGDSLTELQRGDMEQQVLKISGVKAP